MLAPRESEPGMNRKDVLKGRSIVNKNVFDTANQAIDEIKRENPIVEYFRSRGVVLKKRGKEYKGLCPFHEDTDPSLSVNAEKQVFNCFGCGKSGTVIDAAAFYDNLTTGEAIRMLQRKPASFAGTPGTKSGNPDKAEPEAKSKPGKDDTSPAGEKISNIDLNTIAEYYHKKLYDNEPAIKYLKKRGFERPEIFSRFNIGYCDGSLISKLSDKQKEYLIDIGILNEKGHEHFGNCITFPVPDGNDRAAGIYGRDINESSNFKHRYLKGRHRGVFNRKASKVYDEIMLTESIIDALSLIVFGFENAQSIYGTNGFTEEHLRTLKDDRVKTVVIAFDNDRAGKEAGEKLRGKLISEGFNVKVIFPPLKSQNGKEIFYKDWNHCLADGLDPENIKNLVANAEIRKPDEDTPFNVTKDKPGYVFKINEIIYRVTGVKEMFISNLRVNIKAELEEDAGLKYYDNLDMYSARSRAGYSRNLSAEFGLEQKKIDRDLVMILEYLEEERDRALLSGESGIEKIEMTEEEIRTGMEFLKSPGLFDRVVKDMDILGYTGEERNKILMYIIAHSYQLDNPFSVIVTSQSASGKSALVETVEEMMPPEHVISVSSFSDKALNYAKDLDRKFMTISEMMYKDEIEYQLRDIQSKHKLSRLLTMKDLKTGNMESRHVETQAFTSIAMTTTESEINQENASRCFIIQVDESSEQTARILRSQKRKFKLEGCEEKHFEAPEVIRRHRAAGRLLKPYNIFIPYVDDLRFPKRFMRARRDHFRFLYLIAGICHIRQYQKEVKYYRDIAYIEADIRDYELTYDQLVNNNLLSNLTELPRGARDLYEYMRELAVKAAKKKKLGPNEVSLTQRDIREFTGFGQMWVKRHLRILVDYEYVIIARGGGPRVKGHYRIIADEPIEKIDIAGITTPEELREILKKKKKDEKHT